MRIDQQEKSDISLRMAERGRSYFRRTLCCGLASALALALASASEAKADAYCAAVPSEVLTRIDGMVIVSTTYRGWIGVCNVRTAWKGIDPSICWSWFSTVSNAVIQRKGLGLYYSQLAPADCATMGTYDDSPAPYYVRMAG